MMLDNLSESNDLYTQGQAKS